LTAGHDVTPTSATLLERLRDRTDDGAWRRLVDIYRPWLLGWLRRNGLADADAEDLVQDILLVVLKELRFFRHNQRPGAFRSWLRAIAVHRLRDALRGRRYQPVATGNPQVLDQLQQLEDPGSQLTTQWELEHDRHVVGRLLALIEPDFQPATMDAFRRVMLQGNTPAAVATEMGISVNAVLVAKSRILARLRQEAAGLVAEV
jgi:RNA polymerase sigma-70 factor (ECF subfamily)